MAKTLSVYSITVEDLQLHSSRQVCVTAYSKDEAFNLVTSWEHNYKKHLNILENSITRLKKVENKARYLRMCNIEFYEKQLAFINNKND